MQQLSDHFSSHAALYARSRPAYPQVLVDWLADLAVGSEFAWDAGCGSGQLAVPLAARFERVVASDASVGQVMAARRHPRVHYRVARAEASGLPANVADLCTAAQAAHWFDLDAYYPEVVRCARPGAAIALVSYGRPRLAGAPDAALQHFCDAVIGPWWPPQRRHVDDGYRSLPFPFEEVAAPAFEMVHAWDLARFRTYVETWSAVRALERAGGQHRLHDFFVELAAAWGEPVRRRDVHWPLNVRAGTIAAA